MTSRWAFSWLAVVRAVAGPLAVWLLIGWLVTPDPAAVLFLTALVVAVLSAIGPVRRAWFGWIRTGRLRPTRALPDAV